MAPVLDIQDLSTHIKLTSSVVQAVGNIDLGQAVIVISPMLETDIDVVTSDKP